MGTASEPEDDNGRPKAQCALCQLYFHRISLHLKKKHPRYTLKRYKETHPEAALLSEAAEMRDKQRVDEEAPEEEPEEGCIPFGCVSLRQRDRSELEKEDLKWIPVHDEDWIMGESETSSLEALALGMKLRQNVLITGPPGIGKSTLARELAAIIHQPLRRIGFNGEMRLSHLLGRDTSRRDGDVAVTHHSKSAFIDGAERGHWQCWEEIDSGPPHVMMSLHSALEDPPQLTLNQDEGRELVFGDNYRVIATANTLGYGDETGLFSGTGPLNEALIDRFGVTIDVEYPTKSDETKIIVSRTGVEISVAEKMVAVAESIRQLYTTQQTLVSLSPRRLIMWARAAKELGNARRAGDLCVVNKVPKSDKTHVRGIVQRHFGGSS